ncbi:hypothetical protein [Cellulosimicrobium funkei]|uniref:hypothetical protein n=1 Tax=Cellulosimicrobium funkei TaxID=264251 RepID=UPI0036A416B1
MRTTHITIATVCATLVAITAILAWLTAAGHDIQGIASVIVSAIVPTIASLIAVDQASRARAELEGLTSLRGPQASAGTDER